MTGQHYPYSAVGGSDTQWTFLSYHPYLRSHQHSYSPLFCNKPQQPTCLCFSTTPAEKTKCAPLHSLHFPIWQRNKIHFILFKLICKAQSCKTWSENTNLILQAPSADDWGRVYLQPHTHHQSAPQRYWMCGTPKIRMKSEHHTDQRNLHHQKLGPIFYC